MFYLFFIPIIFSTVIKSIPGIKSILCIKINLQMTLFFVRLDFVWHKGQQSQSCGVLSLFSCHLETLISHLDPLKKNLLPLALSILVFSPETLNKAHTCTRCGMRRNQKEQLRKMLSFFIVLNTIYQDYLSLRLQKIIRNFHSVLLCVQKGFVVWCIMQINSQNMFISGVMWLKSKPLLNLMHKELFYFILKWCK